VHFVSEWLKLSCEVNECKPLTGGGAGDQRGKVRCGGQGLTLVHFSARLKHFLWHRECIQRLFRGCLGVMGGIMGGQVIFCVRNGSG
jgi:hypothetical protein